jgi:hypothetical protein
VQWLEQHLAGYAGAVLAVTHDRYFLDNVAQWIAEVDRGRLYPYEGNYSTYLEKKAARLQVQGKKDAKLAKRLRDELEWVRSSAKGRQTKSKARLQRYEEMAAEADRTRKLDFEEIQIPPGPRLGSIVVEGAACYVQIMSTDTPSFSSGTASPTEQMKAALLSTYIAYSGPCTVDDAAGKVTLKVEAAWRPDYVGTEQVRFFRFENGKLLFGPAPSSIRSGETVKPVASLSVLVTRTSAASSRL